MAKGNKKKRERKRVPKEERKNLRLWAEGPREAILAPHLDKYQTALNQGWRQERKYLKKVCREYHARVSWRTLDHKEPVLAEWDPAALILSDDEEEARAARVKILNARIRRWFTYRLRKINKQRSGALDPTKDPYAVLLAKLSGLTAPPKARQAYQQFMRESYVEKIAPVVAEEWRKLQEKDSHLSTRTKKPKAGFHAQIAREVFADLPSAEKKDIAARATGEAAAAKLEYVDALKGPVSTSPEARQKCIDAVGERSNAEVRGEDERQQNIARNARLTEELRASIQADLRPLQDELRAMQQRPKPAAKGMGERPRPRPKKVKPIPGLPMRRSTRGKGEAGTAMDVDPAEGLDTGVMDPNTSGNALPPVLSTAASANFSHPTITGAPSTTSATAPPSASTATGVSTSTPAPVPPLLASGPPSSAVSSPTTAVNDKGNPTPSETLTEARNANASTCGAALTLPPLSHAAHDAIGPNTQTTNPRPTPTSTFLPCPPQAASWFVDAHTAMTKVDLGCHYHALVAAWTRMEQASRFEHGPTNLSHKGRPKQVTTWIGRL
ncbi:hypothetical protein DFH08DRAFT_1085166 [Mycena albidolilacea]|uniref:Uncharacterized protein n=1 Tax=Mycena albidolilacea TaxID=1033008 RepID=A0AAD6ZJZ0_9AGAR|nr:hypothetical protein DFH08DRAFT_1085166 [Mycena albidolilacea]